MSAAEKPDRRRQILEVLADELERHPGSRITTATLAKSVGVSEAALYRHFDGKAKMFEALIDFAEESVFGLINRVVEENPDPRAQCEKILHLALGFAEKNPGITRILLGDALVGEHERLRARVGKFFDRIETQLRQLLREANLSDSARVTTTIDASANQIVALIEGRMSQFVRSDFASKPTANLARQWQVLQAGMFRGG